MNGIFKPEAVSSSAIIAHLDEQQRIQTVAEHCHNVADMAKSFAPPFLAEAAYQCGLYHDTGKCSQEFQQYIRGIRRFESRSFHGRCPTFNSAEDNVKFV
jgi:HD superfamily phosphodiesterase